jgi:MscS family membrane protein
MKLHKISLFLLFLILFSSTASAVDIEFTPFIDKQVAIIEKMDDRNITKEEIKKLLQKQEVAFETVVNKLMSNKNYYINNIKNYDKEIFTIQKIIIINTRAGNSLAVTRDEILLKSYFVIRAQNKMIKDILLALDLPTIDKFEDVLNNSVIKNQAKMQELYKKDYMYLLNLPVNNNSTILKNTQDNTREFYALKDLNSAIIGYIYNYKNKMYRLNKYAKYHILKLVIYVNSLSPVKIINPILETYGLNVIKVFTIMFLIIVIYLFRKIAFILIEKYVLTVDFLQNYSKEILFKIRKTVEIIVIVININMIVYVYNDFSSIVIVSKVFNIFYGFIFTLLVYKIVNAVAIVRLKTIDAKVTNVKTELINVGIKVLNFIIFIIGLLIILYFAGVNLTAVLSGLGIGGFAVAFAAKDTISNFFGTLSVLFSDVFSQGDWIEINGMEGVVVEIGLRVTTIRTFDNALISIPNGTFASNEIKNWDKRVLGRRIKMKLGVKYDSKAEDIKNAVNQIREMLDKHDGIATTNTKFDFDYRHSARIVSKNDLEGVKNTLLVYLDEFSDSSINILVYCFTKSVEWEKWLIVKEDVMHKIMKIFEENNLEFAFPSLSIYNEHS